MKVVRKPAYSCPELVLIDQEILCFFRRWFWFAISNVWRLRSQQRATFSFTTLTWIGIKAQDVRVYDRDELIQKWILHLASIKDALADENSDDSSPDDSSEYEDAYNVGNASVSDDSSSSEEVVKVKPVRKKSSKKSSKKPSKPSKKKAVRKSRK